MRLDKYLKITRLIKRRTIANEACDAGKILINGKVARASYDVKIGDKIEINLGAKKLAVEVLAVAEYVRKDDAPNMYKVVNYTNITKNNLIIIFINIITGGINMIEEKKDVKLSHNLILKERKSLNISGVLDVDSFDDNAVVAYRDLGEVTIKGSKLHIKKINVDSGDLELDGEVYSLEYAEDRPAERGFFSKLFR